MLWKQGSRKSEDGANEREIALDEQSKAPRNDERPENTKSKKRGVLVAFGALLALCLAIGMANCAAVYKQTESIERPSPKQMKKDVKANPSAGKAKADEKSQKAEEGVTVEPSGGNAGTSKPKTGGNGASAGNNGSSGSDGNSGSNGGSSNGGSGSKPQHTHNWVAQTTVVHHEAQYQTIHHDAVVECRDICNQCGADITGNVAWHMEQSFLNGGSCVSHSNKYIETSPAWDEQILVSNAWDETVTTGYACSGCGAIK